MKKIEYNVCLLLGSNIHPEENISRAFLLLQKHVTIVKKSSVWESKAVGSDGPNFLNVALLVTTTMDVENLKKQVLKPVEVQLGRVRTKDKNAPRTIDIDPIIFNAELLDPHVWKYAYCAIPVSEIFPDFKSETGKFLKEIGRASCRERV